MSQKPGNTGPMQHPAEALLHSTRDDYSPTAADRERVRRALIRRLAESADGPAPEATVPPSASHVSLWVKLGVGLVIATGAALAIVRFGDARAPAAHSGTAQLAATSAEAPAPVPSSAAATVPAPPATTLPSSASAPSSNALPAHDRVPLAASARTARSAHPPASRAGNNRRPSNMQSADTAPAAPSEPGDHNTGRGNTPIASDNGQHVSRAADPAAAPTPSEHDEHARAQARNAQNTSPAFRDQAPPAARPESPPTPTTPANAELAFVRRIQAALQAGEPRLVLELSREHERRWPHGTFVQEREGLRTIAACRAHVPRAVSGADKFSSAYPRSPMLSKVHSACTPPSAATPTD